MTNRIKIPRWVIGYAILQLTLAVLFATMAYVNRSFQFPDLVGNQDALFAIGLFANRNFGVAIALVIALFLRDRNMLLAIFLVRFATDVFDFLLAVLGLGVDSAGALVGQLIFFALILWIPEILAIRALWKKE